MDQLNPWLIGCEFSGEVRRAFERQGIEAYSCDLIPSLDNSPRHIIGDVLEVARSREWAGAIFHPTCRYLTRSGLRWITSPPKKLKPGVLYGEDRRLAMEHAIEFVLEAMEGSDREGCDRESSRRPLGTLAQARSGGAAVVVRAWRD